MFNFPRLKIAPAARVPGYISTISEYASHAWKRRSVSGASLAIMTIVVMSCLEAFMTTSCSNTSDKPSSGSASDTSAAAPPKKDYHSKWSNFKQTVEASIVENGRRIDTLRLRASKASKRQQVKYDRAIDEIGKRNRALDEKLSSYQDQGESGWDLFELEFSHDMSALNKSLKNFSIDNVK